MRKLLGLFAAVALATTVLATPAHADTTILRKGDKHGDVKISKKKTISKSKKRSIDISKASIVQLDNGKFRFKVRIKKVHKSKKWDQMVFFDSYYPGGDPTEYTSVSFKIRNSGGAYAYDSVTQDSCKLKVKRTRRTTWVDVPRRCAPWEDHRVVASTATGHYQTDERLYSRDSLNLGYFHDNA